MNVVGLDYIPMSKPTRAIAKPTIRIKRLKHNIPVRYSRGCLEDVENLRGVIKIAKMAKSVEGVKWLGSTFLDTQC